jgi:hypothetical protein
MTSRQKGDDAAGISKPSPADSFGFEELIISIDKREAELNRREEAIVARENQLRIDSAGQRNVLATVASRMDMVGNTPYEEAFQDLPLGVSLALADILEAARRKARSELRAEFEQLATAQAALAATAGRAADPLIKAVTLRANHLERLLDEALARNRELSGHQAVQPSEAEVARLADRIAARTAALIQGQTDGQIS